MISLECSCAELSTELVVLTCPVCSSKAYRALVHLCADVDSQGDLFEEGERVSVSASTELLRFEAEQREFAARPSDGLPF